jgi:cytochrome c peroxidase
MGTYRGPTSSHRQWLLRVCMGTSLSLAFAFACSAQPSAKPLTADAAAADASSPDGFAPITEDASADALAEGAADATPVATAGYPFALPKGFPRPYVPPSNPLTRAKVELGRHLFYDKRLSGNGTMSCASCHEQGRAFTENRATSQGSTGQVHPRNSMSLANIAYAATLTWPNPLLRDLEPQSQLPMFSIDPIIELGVRGKEAEVLERLQREPRYATLFANAFPDEVNNLTFDNIQRAIASFERTLISGNSRFDRYQYGGDVNALTAEEKRGLQLFGTETLECFHCHGGFNFTDSVVHEGTDVGLRKFHNTGLYNVDGKGGFPLENRGLIEFTDKPTDMGKFKAPTLRNIEKTAPYMHDGSIATLEEVVEHYAAGGRTISAGPNAGVGAKNPFKSAFIVSFTIPPEDKAALIAFLKSLTDDAFLSDPALGDPWAR